MVQGFGRGDGSAEGRMVTVVKWLPVMEGSAAVGKVMRVSVFHWNGGEGLWRD